MKNIFTVIISLLAINAIGQTLKTFNGPFTDGKAQNGTAVYTYYEDPNTREYLKQGSFKYTFIGKGSYEGYNQTITGNFEKGLKHGTWTYTITMTDFGDGNPYHTGTVTLVANYKNGYADGNWKEVRSLKSRKKYLQYGQYKWEPFGPLKTMSINMNFKNGYIVGSVSINDEFANFKATGSYDNNGLAIGTWIINDMGWGKNRELIYKDNFLYEFIARSNSGEVLEGSTKYQQGYDNLIKAKSMTKAQMEESGISIDTVCGNSCAATNNIQDYFKKLLVNDYFLYEFIKGDLTYKEGIKGGCDIRVASTNFAPLSNNENFKMAEELLTKNDYIGAYIAFSKIDINIVKPSERPFLKTKMDAINIDSLVTVYTSNTEFFPKYFKGLRDSIEIDSKNMQQLNNLKIIKDDYGWKKYTDRNGVLQSFKDIYVFGSPASCDCPWLLHNFESAKKCFDENKGAFLIALVTYAEYYYKMKDVIESEEKNTTKKYMLGSYIGIPTDVYNKLNGKFNTYDKTSLINNIEKVKLQYEMAKQLVIKETKMIEKLKQIETLYKEAKKKTLYTKFIEVYTDFSTKYQSFNSIQNGNELLTEFNSFADKVIELWTQDTKEIEKKLKSTTSVEQIKSIILGK